MRWLVALVLLCGIADARPGGGHSFSSHSSSHSSGGHYSGSHHYSGGSGSGDVDPTVLLIGLTVLALFLIVWASGKAGGAHSWESVYAAQEQQREEANLDLRSLLAVDPDFSRAVFEDFAYRLYADVHRARGDLAALRRLTPYIAPAALATLADPNDHAVQVVVGAMRIIGVRRLGAAWQLVVRFESNVATAHGTSYRVERWIFGRETGHTKPAATRAWPCPSCGAPWEAGEDPRTCAHCGQAIVAGKLDWAIVDMVVDSSTSVGTTLTGTVPEVGNDYPTVRAANAPMLAEELTAADPAVTWTAVEARVAMIYQRLNAAWNKSDLTDVRGLVTRSLQDYLRYWLDEYRQQGLANHLDDAQIVRFELAKVERDRWYDAITTRVFATGHDYTVRGDKVVGGSRERLRPYTEYWTLLRSSARRGPIVAEPRCPNCGAPLQISDAGACEHCGAELENGSFDWVLSKIEQDDVYAG